MFTNNKDNINIKGTNMHPERLLKNDPLLVLSVSNDGKNKITFGYFTCQPFTIL